MGAKIPIKGKLTTIWPSMEEVLKMVEKHSRDDFMPDSIEVMEGYL